MCHDVHMDSSRFEVGAKANALRRFPALLDSEIADLLGYTVNTLRNYLSTWRSAVEGDPTVKVNRGGTKDASPDADEMRWRFANQDVGSIIERFGAKAGSYIQRLGLTDEAPEALIDRLRANGWIDSVEQTKEGITVQIGDSGLVIMVNTLDLATFANGLCRFWQSYYDIPDTGWAIVKDKLETRVRVKAMWADAKDPKAVNELRVAEQGFDKEPLPFPLRHSRNPSDAIQKAIDDAQQYADEHGYKETIACGFCGTQIAIYYNQYVSAAEFIIWARDAARGLQTPEEALDLAKAIAHAVHEHPFLARELRDIGMAWSYELMDELLLLAEEFPECITMERVKRIMARVLHLGEAALDERIPISPLHRVKLVDGVVTVSEAKV